MLAKKIKMANIKKQREYIETEIEHLSQTNTDGDTSYIYIGCLFPEVKKHFIDEGFDIVEFNKEVPAALAVLTKGRSLYIFTVKEDIVLSDEELDAVEKIETPNERLDKMFEQIKETLPMDDPSTKKYLRMLSMIHGIALPASFYIDDDDNGEVDYASVFKKFLEQEDVDDGYEDNP